MIRNYLIVAWRNLWKHKLFSLINITGLTISISVALVVYLIIDFEYGFDKHHTEADRIFRVVSKSYFLGEEYHNPGVPIPLAQAVKDNISGIEEAAGFFQIHNYPVMIPTNGGNKILKQQQDAILTDPGYFRILKHSWLAGNAEAALREPFRVVLSESKAKSYFNIDDATLAIGRDIIYRDSIQTVVAGIVRDHEHPTDFDFTEYISISTVYESSFKDQWYLDHWDNIDSDFQLVVKLNEGVAPAQVDVQLTALLETHLKGDGGVEQESKLQPLSDIHFNAGYGVFNGPVANKSTLGGLTVMALLIILLGSINYINLTTARGTQRTSEVGIRKALGGNRFHIVFQFITETVLLTLLAALCALVLAPYILELFNSFVSSEIAQAFLWRNHVLLFLFTLSLVLGIITGLYPGLVLSRNAPALIIKDKWSGSTSGRPIFQQALSVVQFAITMFFVVTTLVVTLQIRHALTLEMGFNTEGIITFALPNSDPVAANSLQEMFGQISEISKVSRGGASPASSGVQSRSVSFTRGEERIETHVMFKFGDENYLPVYGIDLIAGKNLSSSDSVKEFIINQAYLTKLGITEETEAIGQLIKLDGINYPIVGVVKDFHTQPIYSTIEPAIITNVVDNSTLHVSMILSGDNAHTWSTALSKMEAAWVNIYKDETFNYQFYDQRIASWYQREHHTSALLKWIMGVSIFISCLGLLGLALLITINRTKEIGIRKVLGASVTSIVTLFSNGLIKLVFIAVVLSIPVAWFVVSNWLSGFAYQIDIKWWMFVLPAIFVLTITMFTIGSQILRIALANPVDALRNE